jgi:hypothetical protein
VLVELFVVVEDVWVVAVVDVVIEIWVGVGVGFVGGGVGVVVDEVVVDEVVCPPVYALIDKYSAFGILRR